MPKTWCLLLPIMTCSGVTLADPPPVRRADVVSRAEGMFRIADANHDGWLTREEYHRVLMAIAKIRGATPTPAGWAAVDAQFDAIDDTHSGRISHDRFVAAAVAHFDRADLNHDGTVTPDEARKAAKQTRRQPGR